MSAPATSTAPQREEDLTRNTTPASSEHPSAQAKEHTSSASSASEVGQDGTTRDPSNIAAKEGAAPAKVDKDGKHWLQNDTQVIPDNNLWIVFPSLMLCVFLAALDQTIVSTALPTIAADIGASAAGYSWVGSAYLLTACAMIPLYGRMSDLVGRKPLFFIAIGLFLFGSGMCGAAQSTIWLCTLRGVQGMGGGGIIGLVQTVTSDIVPLHKRGAFQGLFGATWGIASVLGPLIGGALTEAGGIGWRWCFLINLPIGAIAAVLLWVFLNCTPVQRRHPMSMIREFDFVGYILLLAAVVIFIFGFTQAEVYGFNTASAIALIVIGGCLFPFPIAWAFFIEKRYPHIRPIMPPRIFRLRTTTIILFTVIMHGIPFFMCTYLLPIYYQSVKGASALLSGVYLLPYALIGSAVSVLSGVAVVKLKSWRNVYWYGWTLSVIGYSLMTMIGGSSHSSSWAVVEATTAVAGLGYGALFQVPLLGMMAAMPSKEIASVTSTVALCRSLSGAVGIALGEAIFNAKARSLTANIPGYSAPADPSSDIDGLRDIQPDSLREQVLYEYGQAMHVVFIAIAPMIAAGFLASLGVKNYSMQRNNVQGPARDGAKGSDTPRPIGEGSDTPQPIGEGSGEKTPAQLEEGRAAAGEASESLATEPVPTDEEAAAVSK